MRTKLEQINLQKVKEKSLETKNRIADWKSPKGEYFIFENGELTEYTDTRVINHSNDRIINLTEQPFVDK